MNRRLLSALAASFALTTSVLAPPAAAAACSVDQPVDDQPYAFVECTGVHPGMRVVAKSNRGWAPCVAGFAFADQYGNRYLTIPGDCVLIGECRWPALLEDVPEIVKEIAHGIVCEYLPHHEEKRYRKPAVVTDALNRRIGAVVYAVHLPDETNSVESYFNLALVRLDKGVRLDPALPFFGGPTRLGDFGTEVEDAYAVSPLDYDARLPNARSGPLVPLLYGPDPWTARHHRSGVWPLSGQLVDGTPVMRPDGSALGYYASRNVGLASGYLTMGYRRQLARAQRFTGLRLRLLTAPLAG